MEEYRISGGKKLRCGYTTGTCAAAAAKAAAAMLFSGIRLDYITINTPKGIALNLDTQDILLTDSKAVCAIRKDAGDDPDDTDGVLVYATVEKFAGSELELLGGIGVGTVTKPGLACSVGGPAINPTPSRMIRNEVAQVAQKYGYNGGIKITISIPEGVEIAKKTFNPRLGIIGGLSVLGTTGIVEPMSEKALVDTLFVEMDVQISKGNKNLLAFFGNYGQDYAKDILGLNISDAVTCSNFVGELLDYAVFCGFESVFIIGHSGKLVKLAQGVMNTHSKYADCRTEILALYAMYQGIEPEVGKEIANTLTTDEAVKVLKREGLDAKVLKMVNERIDYYMQQRVHGKIKTAAMMFSNIYGILGKTVCADELIRLQLENGGINRK
ncbi:MAG: cobalamin biosynthesis protein CbiD [Negativicutes bacterium]|nr:cobalamin biosynthesis protein CbiD [Negativicutes bacterium]